MGQLSSLARLPLVRKLAATLTLSAAGVAGIVQHEASVPVVYRDVAGINTVCVGHVTSAPVGSRFTNDECAELLQADTQVAQDTIRKAVKVPISQDQYDSLVSFVFNVGTGAFKSSTLLRKLNAGDCRGAASEFPKWDMAGGKHVPGLLRRRQDEASHFVKDCP